MRKLSFILTALLALLPQVAPAEELASPWATANEVQVRLLSGQVAADTAPTVTLGLEIRLAPHWKTYWRTPGTAGLPVTIDWTGSTNLKSADISWPAPQRFEFSGIESFGYTDEVVLPVTAHVETPGQPLHLSAAVNMMACADLCIPFNFNLALDIPAGQAVPSDSAETISGWQQRVPQAVHEGLSIDRVEILGNTYSVTVTAEPPLTTPELIVEAPSGRMYDAPKLVQGTPATLSVTQIGADQPGDKPDDSITVTLIDGDRAIEKTVMPVPMNSAPPEVFSLARLLSALGAAFIGGLILNLMPCVLPVLSLKLLAVVSHGGSPPAHVRYSFLASAAGIIASFLALGGIAIGLKQAGMAVGWGLQFQHPAFILTLTLIITLFAASLWNLIHIPLPRFLADAINDRLPAPGEHDRTLLGNFITGAFATILATPCSAPFVGTALGFALSGSTLDIALVALSMGLGLALPFLLVAAFPQLANKLPRPGKWMNWLKAVLGIALLFTAIWLAATARQQLDPVLAPMVAGIPLVILAVLWIRASIARPAVFVKGIAGMIIVLGLVAASEHLWPAGSAARIHWQPFEQARISQLVAEGKTVFVDVTAEWCLTCIANKKLVLSAEPTISLLNADNVVAMQADWTKPDPAIADYLRSFGRYGIPFNVIYGPGAPQGIALPELLSAETVAKGLQQASSIPEKNCPSC